MMKSQFTYLSMAVAAAAAMAFAGVVMMGAPRAQATPAAAAATKLGCPACHAGAPSKANLTDRGKQYQSTGK